MLNLFSICFFYDYYCYTIPVYRSVSGILGYIINDSILKVSITLIVYCLLLMVLLFSMLRFTLHFYYHQELLVFFLL